MEKMLTVREVAQILGLRENTVYGWIRNGKIKSVKLSYKIVRIKESDLIGFMEAK
jgi:excisionase family DNA binding protein